MLPEAPIFPVTFHSQGGIEMLLRDSCKTRRKLTPTCLAGVVTLAAGILIAGCQPSETSSGTDKGACAEIIQRAIANSRSRDEAEKLVRVDPQARKVCAGLEMNGVPVIP
jgi:hypothetical protein